MKIKKSRWNTDNTDYIDKDSSINNYPPYPYHQKKPLSSQRPSKRLYSRKIGISLTLNRQMTTLKPFILIAVLFLTTETLSAREPVNERSLQMLENILKNAPSGIGVVKNRVIIQANDYILELTGYTHDELIGKDARVLYPTQKDYDYVGHEKHRQISERGTGTVETRWIDKEENILNVILSSTPLDPNDLAKGVTFTVLDITERKQAQAALAKRTLWFKLGSGAFILLLIILITKLITSLRYRKNAEKALADSEKKLRQVIDLVPHFIFAKNADGKFVIANKAVADFCGTNTENLIGINDYDLNPNTQQVKQFIVDERKVIESGTGLYAIEEELINSKGEKRLHETTKIPFTASGTSKPEVLGISVDITEHKQAEEKLIRERILLRTIIDSIPDAIYVKDMECRKILSNKADYNNIGFNKEEDVIGKNDFDVYPPEIAQSFFEKDQKVLKHGESLINIEEKLIKNNGDIIWLLTTKLPLYNEKEEMIGLVGIGHNITERKRAEEALARVSEEQHILLDNIQTQVWYLTDATTYGAVNKAHAEFKGMKIEEMAFKSFYDLYPEDLVNKWKKSNEKVFSSKTTIQSEKWITDAQGKQRFIAITKTPRISSNGTVDYVVCSAEDFTEQKQAEEVRQQLEIAKKTAQFKQNFLANISHEMRTPLTGILGFTDILAKTKLDAKQSDYLISVQQSGENLREIINNVLDYSKIEAGKIKLKKSVFKLDNLLHNAESMFKSICKKPVDFDYSVQSKIPEYIKADKNRITQVINNLISNAVKFTAKGKISVKAELIKRDEKTKDIELKVYISDTGKGIAKEDSEKLFKPFSQIDDKDTRLYDGAGLGLSICKDIVKLHGGIIGVDSKSGKGSTFWFTFTAKEAAPEEYTKQNKMDVKSRKAKNLRILLVEDVKVSQKVFEITLSSLGHKVKIAGNGKEALEIYKSGKFDLILMDIQMPVMDGITATKKLKEKYKKLPPIVGLSANAFEGDREKYMEKGMDEYLTKPLNIEDFSQVVDKLF